MPYAILLGIVGFVLSLPLVWKLGAIWMAYDLILWLAIPTAIYMISRRGEKGQRPTPVTSPSKDTEEVMKQIALSSVRLVEESQQVRQDTETIREGAQKLIEAKKTLGGAIEEIVNATEMLRQRQETLQNYADSALGMAEDVKNTGERLMAASTEGKNVLEQMKESIEKIIQAEEKSRQVIQSLKEKSRGIGELVAAIGKIAEKTNLLALNAAIEAARAGEAGRGFAVVASEIRKLAEQTRGISAEITRVLGEIQQSVDQAMGSTNLLSSELESVVDVSKAATDKFSDILNQIDLIEKSIQEVVRMGEETRDVAESMSTATQMVSGAVEKLAVEEENLSKVAEDILKVSEDLSKSVAASVKAAADTADSIFSLYHDKLRDEVEPFLDRAMEIIKKYYEMERAGRLSRT